MFASTLDPTVQHFPKRRDGQEGPTVSLDGAALIIGGVCLAVEADRQHDMVIETDWDEANECWRIKTLKAGWKRLDNDPECKVLMVAAEMWLDENQPDDEGF